MLRRRRFHSLISGIFLLGILIVLVLPSGRKTSQSAERPALTKAVSAQEPTAEERGYDNLIHHAYGPPILNPKLLEALRMAWDPAWKAKADLNDPDQIRKLAYERYGFSEAPYPNGGAPMQFVATNIGWVQGCLLCHGGRVPGSGQSMIGMPNTELDMATLYEDLSKLIGVKGPFDLTYGMTRGRTNAVVFGIELLRRRNEDLSRRDAPLDLGPIKDFDLDPIPWWHLKKKNRLYVDGGITGDLVRPIMQFTLVVSSGEKIKSWEPEFKDILAYLRSIEPPKYPWPIDAKLAGEGKRVFERTCAQCHGTYGTDGKYPNRVVPIEVVGTDPLRLTGTTKEARAFFNRTWFGEKAHAEEMPVGYLAPPLDGVWASAPYFHNGSVPTVYGVLTQEARPKYFRRVGAPKEYDTRDLGFKFEALPGPAAKDQASEARRRVIDTTLPGLGNQGHPFGFSLTEKEKRQVIEYLKTI